MMMPQSSIEVILFDLGNVILPFEHRQIGEKLFQFCLRKEMHDPARIFAFLFDLHRGAVNLYETGKMSDLEFFRSVREAFGLQISFELFASIWNEIFTENEEVSEIIRSFKGKKKLGLVSNTNSLHFDYILSKYPVVRIFDRWILSHKVGFKKPSPEIYQRAIEWAAVEPERILFIDDMEKNVKAASTLGIRSIHFLSAGQLKRDLSLLLNSR